MSNRAERVKTLVEKLLSEDKDCGCVAPKPNKRSDSMKKSYQKRRDAKTAKSMFKPGKADKTPHAK